MTDTKLIPKGDHETEKVILTEEEVDKNIIPLVKWLNSFPGVETKFSCEGEEESKKSPYVLFYCDNTISLVTILNATRYYADTEVSFYKGHLRYTLRFFNKVRLRNFIKAIEANDLTLKCENNGAIKKVIYD